MLSTLGVLTTVVVGLLVGVDLSVAFVINRILDALPEESAQLGRSHGAGLVVIAAFALLATAVN